MTGDAVVGVLHPGQMGAAVASAVRRGGLRTLWCPAGRGRATVLRAEKADLEPVADLGDLLEASDVVLSICPPAFAEDVAEEVAAHLFEGIFVDANAISPERLGRIASRVAASGARVVDGALFGPRREGDTTRLYLAGTGRDVQVVSSLFTAPDIVTISVGEVAGRASTLKMAHSTFQKSARVLSAVAHALAAERGVAVHLQAEADGLGSALAELERLPGVAARSWRWEPEMREVVDTLASSGLPTEMVAGAADVMKRWKSDRDAYGLTVDVVLRKLREAPPGEPGT